nr:response regulator [Synechococcus elongatus PCC 11801]
MYSSSYSDSQESNLVVFPMAATPKTALLVQVDSFQAKVWSAALASQSITVIQEATNVDLGVMLEQMGAAGLTLPDLVIVDMASEGMNPFAFCRFCRNQYPNVKVLLTNSTQTQVTESEQRWAISQGAQDLLPAFQTSSLLTDLITALGQTTQVLGLPILDQQALIQILPKLLETPAVPGSEAEAVAEAPAPTVSQPPAPPAPETPKPQRFYRGRPY